MSGQRENGTHQFELVGAGACNGIYYIDELMIILAPEELSTTSSPKRELTQHDIGTLKQQLHEIKEQVRIFNNYITCYYI